MRSALARLCFKQSRKDKDLHSSTKGEDEDEDEDEDEESGIEDEDEEEEIEFAPWHSSTKGDGSAPQLNGARYFSFQELKEYTDNFSENNIIRVGGFGKVYKGCCSNGVIVAVKRGYKPSPSTSQDRKKQFHREIEVLSRVHHKNIVNLVGFCLEQGELLLVYEYMSKGSLRYHLAGKSGTYLDWQKRLQIALDSARALAYLHELANPLIIHKHVKSTNILLDQNLNAKVAGFGLSKMVSEKEKGHVSSQGRGIIARLESETVQGTFGYLDPEYFKTQVLSEKSDVYSFGVVMLELITARPVLNQGAPREKVNLVEWVMSIIDENDEEYYGIRDIIDPEIVNQVTRVGLRKFVQLALECLKDYGLDRPSMYEIMKEIDIILQHDGRARVNRNC